MKDDIPIEAAQAAKMVQFAAHRDFKLGLVELQEAETGEAETGDARVPMELIGYLWSPAGSIGVWVDLWADTTNDATGRLADGEVNATDGLIGAEFTLEDIAEALRGNLQAEEPSYAQAGLKNLRKFIAELKLLEQELSAHVVED